MLKGNAFLKGPAPGAQPFTGAEFQQVVAATLGANQDINAPVLAFVAFKLAELLGDPAWNVKAQKVDTGVASRFGFTYLTFLDMAGGAEWHDGDGTLPAGRRGWRGTRAVAAHRT